MQVVLFLSTTLKKNIFYQLLQEKPTAIAQYVQYLSTRHLKTELIDLLSYVHIIFIGALFAFFKFTAKK